MEHHFNSQVAKNLEQFQTVPHLVSKLSLDIAYAGVKNVWKYLGHIEQS